MATKPSPRVEVDLVSEIPSLMARKNPDINHTWTWEEILGLLKDADVDCEFDEVLTGITNAEQKNHIVKTTRCRALAFRLTGNFLRSWTEPGH